MGSGWWDVRPGRAEKGTAGRKMESTCGAWLARRTEAPGSTPAGGCGDWWAGGGGGGGADRGGWGSAGRNRSVGGAGLGGRGGRLGRAAGSGDRAGAWIHELLRRRIGTV